MSPEISESIYISRPFRYLDILDGSADGKRIKTEDGKVIELDHILHDVLFALRYPADLPLLEKRLEENGWDDSAFSALEEYLEELIDQGLAEKLATVIDGYDTQEVKEEYDFPDFYVFPTKDKPHQLERAVEAWNSRLKSVSLQPDLVVADASATAGDGNRAWLDRFKNRFAGAVYYLGNTERWNFVRQFSAPIRKSVEFALSMSGGPEAGKGMHYGVNRNFALLLGSGHKTAMADDDVLPEFKIKAENKERINLFSEMDPSTVTPAADWAELEQSAVEGKFADYAEYVSYCGEPLKEFFSLCRQIDFNLADYSMLKDFARGTRRAAAVCHFYWGDSGMGTASYLLASRDRITCDISDAERYEKMMNDRLVMRSLDYLTAGGSALMGGHAVFDTTDLLPPFSPLGRNEDQLWSYLLAHLHPDAAIVYSPLSIKHSPMNPQAGSRERATRWEMGLNETIQLVLGFLLRECFPSENTYAGVSELFRDFLTKPDPEPAAGFSDLVVLAAQSRQQQLIRNLEVFGPEPEWWAEDVYAAIEWLNEYIKMEKFWIPKIFRDSANPQNDFFSYCRSFAGLLGNWEKIYEEAEKISPAFLEENRLK